MKRFGLNAARSSIVLWASRIGLALTAVNRRVDFRQLAIPVAGELAIGCDAGETTINSEG